MSPKKNSKEKIIATALELFSLEGFEKTSVRDIAKAAGVSLGLMYNYFNSKEVLLQAIIAEGVYDMHHFFVPEGGSAAPLENFVHQFFDMLEKKQKHWKLLHIVRMQQHLAALLMPELETTTNYMIGELSMILQQQGYAQPVQEAVLLTATMDGMASQFLINPRYPLHKMMQLLVDKYQHHPS